MKQRIIFAVLSAAMLFTSCKEEFLAPDISGVETSEYVLNIGDKLTLAPDIKNVKGNDYSWTVNGKKIANATTDYTFVARQPGTFDVVFKASNKGGAADKTFKIVVEAPIDISFSEAIYVIPKCSVLEIAPKITGPQRNDYQYEWTLGDAVIGKEKNIDFIEIKPGNYELQLKVSAGKQTETTTCNVKVEEAKYNAQAISILDYTPAANSYWHLTSEGKKFNDYIFPRDKFIKVISEDLKKGIVKKINVGNWGSSVTVGFDHTIVNVAGKDDIALFNGNHIPEALGFYVAYDKNGNGKPDDSEWYLIKPKLNVEEYERTFTFIGKPEFETKGKYRYCTFTYEVKDNKNVTKEKTISRVIYDYPTPLSFPGYFVENEKIEMKEGWKSSYTLKGKMTSITKPNFLGNSMIYIDIADAVNGKGEPVVLPGIDFLKIQQFGIIYDQDPAKGEVTLRNEILSIKDNHL